MSTAGDPLFEPYSEEFCRNHPGSCSYLPGRKATPSSVAGSATAFENWLIASDVFLLCEVNPAIQEIQRAVEVMSELVVPQEWGDPTYNPQFDKVGAAAFRQAVVSAASPTSFKDDRDSRAILGSFNTLLALSQDTRKQSYNASIGNKEAMFRRHMDALFADVFDHQYVIDGKPEFGGGNFCFALKESIWLKENPITSTNEARPDTIVAYGPINAKEIYMGLRAIVENRTDARENTTTLPLQLPSSRPSPIPTYANPAFTDAKLASDALLLSQIEQVADLFSNVHFLHSATTAHLGISLIATVLEYKTASKLHNHEQLCMDFTTAQIQRCALLLPRQTLFGFAVDREGVSVHASFWSNDSPRLLCISAQPVHDFHFRDNTPLQLVKLFLFLRRLAKKMVADFEQDNQTVTLKARDIASSLAEGKNIWRPVKSSMPSRPLQPAAQAPSGPLHSRPSSPCGSDGPHSSKRQKCADTGNTSGLHTDAPVPAYFRGFFAHVLRETEQTLTSSRDTLTTENLSRFDEYEGFGERVIGRWAARVERECVMDGGEPSGMMEDLDQEELCMDGEVSVPDAEATAIEMSPEKVSSGRIPDCV